MRDQIANRVPWSLRPTKIQHTLVQPLARSALWLSAMRSSRSAGVDQLGAVLVINLASRPDRLAMFDIEMRSLRIEARRVEAISDPIGILGCTRSHAVCLRQMLEEDWETMMVCEDDARFRVSRQGLDVLVDRFVRDEQAEVACLSFHLRKPPSPRSLFYFRARDTQTTACYLVKRSIAAELLALCDYGANELSRGGNRDVFGVDMIWKQLQGSRVFLVSAVRAVIQADGFSDVERREVSYRM